MNVIDLIKFLLDNYDREDWMEWCFHIWWPKWIDKINYYVWCNGNNEEYSSIPYEIRKEADKFYKSLIK